MYVQTGIPVLLSPDFGRVQKSLWSAFADSKCFPYEAPLWDILEEAAGESLSLDLELAAGSVQEPSLRVL